MPSGGHGEEPPNQRAIEWTTEADRHLTALVGVVAALKSALAVEAVEAVAAVDESGVAVELASDVVAAGDALLKWLGGRDAPDRLLTAEGELAAAAGVYRNAASLFRSLSTADPEQRTARLVACSTTLSQGDHHVEVFRNEVRAILHRD